jgi:hypothetical protein
VFVGGELVFYFAESFDALRGRNELRVLESCLASFRDMERHDRNGKAGRIGPVTYKGMGTVCLAVVCCDTLPNATHTVAWC